MKPFSGLIVATGILIAVGCNKQDSHKQNQFDNVMRATDLVFNVEGLT